MRLVNTVLAVCALACQPATAQYLGLNLQGDLGLKAGSQPDPGIYLTLPLYYRNAFDSVHGADGRSLIDNFSLDVNIFMVPAATVVTNAKFLGATYGFQVVPLVMNQRLAIADTSPGGGIGYGFGDLYVQPVNLGWRTSRADFLAAYGFYAPTGGEGRTLDMWANEIVGGFTVYFDPDKRWNVSTAASYDINLPKRNADIKVGQIMTLEGGAGWSFRKGAGNVGAAYVAQWKLTHDSGAGIPPILHTTDGRVFGVGPEISLPVFAKGRSLGIVGFRYIFECGAKTNFQGQTLAASFTFAHILGK
jgi:hypothetical protein